MRLKNRTRRCKKQVLENRFQLLSIKEVQEQVIKTGKAIDLAPLPICDPT